MRRTREMCGLAYLKPFEPVTAIARPDSHGGTRRPDEPAPSLKYGTHFTDHPGGEEKARVIQPGEGVVARRRHRQGGAYRVLPEDSADDSRPH